MNYEKISRPISLDFPDEWYALNLGSHFWFAWRLRVLRHMLASHNIPLNAPWRALEIGCGVGFLRSQIEAVTAWTVDGADLNESALADALPARGRTMLYDVCERLPELRASYDAIILFDVIEHLSSPDVFLQAAAWHLKPGGILLVNVPALNFLFSRYDKMVGHFQRYTVSSFQRLLEQCGFDFNVMDRRYWGFSLVPVAWLRKFLVRNIKTPAEAIAIGFKPPAPWINQMLLPLMRLETSLLHHPPSGTSLMIAARKRT